LCDFPGAFEAILAMTPCLFLGKVVRYGFAQQIIHLVSDCAADMQSKFPEPPSRFLFPHEVQHGVLVESADKDGSCGTSLFENFDKSSQYVSSSCVFSLCGLFELII
jgi:hypothetical protein